MFRTGQVVIVGHLSACVGILFVLLHRCIHLPGPSQPRGNRSLPKLSGTLIFFIELLQLLPDSLQLGPMMFLGVL